MNLKQGMDRERNYDWNGICSGLVLSLVCPSISEIVGMSLYCCHMTLLSCMFISESTILHFNPVKCKNVFFCIYIYIYTHTHTHTHTYIVGTIHCILCCIQKIVCKFSISYISFSYDSHQGFNASIMCPFDHHMKSIADRVTENQFYEAATVCTLKAGVHTQ